MSDFPGKSGSILRSSAKIHLRKIHRKYHDPNTLINNLQNGAYRNIVLTLQTTCLQAYYILCRSAIIQELCTKALQRSAYIVSKGNHTLAPNRNHQLLVCLCDSTANWMSSDHDAVSNYHEDARPRVAIVA